MHTREQIIALLKKAPDKVFAQTMRFKNSKHEYEKNTFMSWNRDGYLALYYKKNDGTMSYNGASSELFLRSVDEYHIEDNNSIAEFFEIVEKKN